MKRFAPILIVLITVLALFFPITQNRLPIPADALVGLYHPFRDALASEFPSGIAYKNFLTTDPVRQQFLWKKLAIDQLKIGQIPWWNPYTHSGTPLLANFQAGVFYPLNIIFFFLNFTTAWTLFIFIQPLLAGLFFYMFLQNKKFHPIASSLGTLSFIFGGFFMVWLEWGNLGHTILWLPLLLLSIDKISQKSQKRWQLIFIFSLISQFFAGHLQTSFYVLLTVLAYIIYKKKYLLFFSTAFLVFALITSFQWLPTLEYLNLSARSLDQASILTRPDWFIPLQHIVQVFAPDFFGNPATLNYWGVWNYAEFVSYIGLIPLIFAVAALFNHKRPSSNFFSILLFTTLLFATPNYFSKLPFLFKIPFLSQAQPSRLLSLITFSLAFLAASGFNQFIKKTTSRKILLKSSAFVGLSLVIVWLIAIFYSSTSPQDQLISIRNLILPTAVFVFFTSIIYVRKHFRSQFLFSYLLLLVTAFDLFRFAHKFTPFAKAEYLFPQTKVIDFLKQDKDIFRIMSLDRRILPPNTTMAYNIQTIEGYDPLYLKSYAQLITELETGQDQQTPIAFNRIITPQNLNSDLVNKLNVKYILTLKDLENPHLELVFQEGQTRVYQNTKVNPRARFVQGEGTLKIISYLPQQVSLSVAADSPSTIELADMSYPGWHVTVDNDPTTIQTSQYNFRQVSIPPGDHSITFTFKKYNRE